MGLVGGLRRLGELGGLGQVRQVGQGENCEFWIGYEQQACASGGKDWAKDRDSYLYLTKEEMDKKVKNGEIHIYTSTL